MFVSKHSGMDSNAITMKVLGELAASTPRAQVMLTLSLVINIAVLLPVCLGILRDSAGM